MTRDEARQFYFAAMNTCIPNDFFDMVAGWDDERRALMIAGMRAIMPQFYSGEPVVPTGLPSAFATVKTIWDGLETKDALVAGEKGLLGLNIAFDLIESLDNKQGEALQALMRPEQMDMLLKLFTDHLSDYHQRRYGHLKAEIEPERAQLVTGGASLPEETLTIEAVDEVIGGISDQKLAADRLAIQELLLQSQRA